MSLKLIKKYEGLRLKAYKCPAGVQTIGYGTTFYPNGNKVQEGDVCTPAEAEAYLKHYVDKHIKLPDGLTTNQKAALLSLIYNIGQPAFDKSKLKLAILARDYQKIIQNWDWVKAGGKQLKGLAKRRAEELDYFFKDL